MPPPVKSLPAADDSTSLADSGQSSRWQPSFWKFFSARVISILGDRAAELVIPVLVLNSTQSAFIAGLIAAVNWVPALFSAFWIGLCVDRSSKRALMLGADIGRAVAFAILATAIFLDQFSVPLLVIVVFMVGVGDLLFATAASAFVVGLVGRNHLATANGRLEAGDAAATIAGPAVGGLFLYLLGATGALLTNAASFVISALFLAAIRLSTAASGATSGAHKRISRTELFIGMRLLWHVPQLRLLQIILIGLNIETSAIVLLVVALTKDVLMFSEVAIGFVLTGAGIGGLLTSLFLAPRLSRWQWGPMLATLFLISAGAAVAFALVNTAVAAFLVNAALDGAIALAFVAAGTVRQTLTPDTLLGRVAAASYLLNVVARMVGVVSAGLLIRYLGHQEAFVGFGLLLALIGVWAWRAPITRVRISELKPLSLSSEGGLP